MIRMAIAVTALASWELVASAQGSHSEPVARQLSQLMQQRKLDAFAAKNPDTPNGFVAVLLFPNVQLLLVAGEPMSVSTTQQQLDQKQYMDVYATLQQAVMPNTKVFFQDLQADGLHAKSDAVDVVYERVATQTIFDGEPSKHHLTDAQYAQRFSAADTQYSRLLSALLDSLRRQAVNAAAKR
jgi:hypothetical protein